MRAQGDPLRPFVAVPLPTLAVVQAALPVLATEMLFWALGAAVLIAWYGRLRPWLARPTARFVAAALLAAMLLEGVRYDLLDVPESWAGLLLALSLALWRPGRWIEPAAFGLAATLVCIAAAPYLVVMGGIAIFEGRRREAIGWALALGILTIVLAAHAHAVAQIVRPLDAGGPDGMTLPGVGPVLRAIMESTAPGRLPSLLATLVLGLALFGWTAWRDALAVRVVALFATGVVMFAVAGRAGGSRDGLVFAPLLPVGLLFAVDGLRDLGRIALDRRRITVKRVVR
jgi:hypothetical protein